MQNAGGCYVVGNISNKIKFMPNPRIGGAASAFVAVPPLVYIEILPHCFRTNIILFPDLNENLEGMVFKIKGTRTMQMEGTVKPSGDLIMSSQQLYASPRVRRVCSPPPNFSASYDFPAPVTVNVAADADNDIILTASRLPNGNFQVDVPRPGGEVDLSPYPFIRTSEW